MLEGSKVRFPSLEVLLPGPTASLLAFSLISTCLACTATAGADATLSAPASKFFSLAAARSIVNDSEPRISPDGRHVVYVRAHPDFAADTTLRELVLVDVATGRARTLTRDREGVSTPAWSPRGDRLAFLAAPQAKKPAQLYVLPMDGGDAQKVTDATAGVEAFAWRPDGSQLAFTAQDAAPNAKEIAAHLDAFAVEDEHFLSRTASLPSHVWLVGADGTGAAQLTTGAASVVASEPWLQWSPDGKTLLYPQQPDGTFAHFTKSRAIAYDVATHAEHPVVAAPVVSFATFSADGSKIAYVAPRHASVYLQSDAYVVNAKDGTQVATSLAVDRNEKWLAFLPDGSLAYAAPDGIRNGLWRIPARGEPRRVELGDVDFAPDASVAKDGTIAFVGQSKSRPPEIYVLPAGAKAHRVSNDNAFIDSYALGRAERIDWPTDDGMTACGVLTYPPNFKPGTSYPLVLIIHGGPVSTSTQNFSVSAQTLAARGFLVFNPNYRGSDDLGDAYLQAIVGHPTSGPGRDNLAGLAAVQKLGIVDSQRIGVSGWSGGGLQTSWLIGHSHVWKAALSGAGVDDWYEQALLADINEEFADVFMGGATPWTSDGRALFASESPITYAGSITTPLLILSDTSDQRVPITQSYALFHALRDRGQRVKFVAFPRAGHFPTDPVGAESVYRTWFDWFSTELAK